MQDLLRREGQVLMDRQMERWMDVRIVRWWRGG
jgi:hypothetical protein